GWRWVVTACGVWECGAVLVPLASRWKAPEVAPLLERSGARWLFAEQRAAGEDLLPALAAHCGAGGRGRPLGGIDELEGIVALDAETAAPGAPETEAWADFLATGEGTALAPLPAAPEGLAQILFTSGTTGAPKGVELRERQLLQSYWDWSGIGALREGDRFLVIPPYSHGFGINGGILACLLRGVTNLPMAVFSPEAALEIIAREQISVISGPPTLFATLMDLPAFDPAAVASLRTAFVGAASVPTEIIQRMRDRMGIERVCNAYGLIETCVISMTRADDPLEVISTTTGRPLPGVGVRVVDAEGVDLGPGEAGEILVRGQGIMSGYWRDPEQSAATVDAEGWARTGDVGSVDAAGHVRILDRLKDAYNCGGFSAYPAEIENRLLEIDELAQVAVVGVPDERLGEVGCAFVMAAEGREVDPDSVIAWARENMANYKVPRRVFVLEALPMNANGKVMKSELRARAGG
ncbi:MAG: AMP-binding protein, partial [Myxococcales bacterium]|nr:AMP-binding protein [Myxococcales bacterium]